MKKFFWLILIILASCEKDTECNVIYKITDSVSGFDVRFLNESSELIAEKVTTQSAQDVWNYSFTSEEGGIVFLSANYDDPESAIKVQIYVDGKIYKQAASRNDTTSFITVSGTIPIKE